jgi:hypothetical protein
MKRMFARLLVAAGVLLGPLPVLDAHHGAASFDPDKKATLTGTVTEWLWANPHCFLRLDVKDEKGAVVNWSIEFGNPTDISIRGFKRTSFKPGEEVTIMVQPVKNGSPVARVQGDVTLANGQKL